MKIIHYDQTMQHWSTNDMIFDVPTLIEFLSGEGIGSLTNPVAEEAP